jgi:hypothetical protein
MKTRYYKLIAVNEQSGWHVDLADIPLTHHEACTMKNRFTVHKERRIEIVELTSEEELLQITRDPL